MYKTKYHKFIWSIGSVILLAMTILFICLGNQLGGPQAASRISASAIDFINPELRLGSGAIPIISSLGIMPLSYSSGVQFIHCQGRTWTLSVNSQGLFPGFQLFMSTGSGNMISKTGSSNFISKLEGMPTDCTFYRAYIDYQRPVPTMVISGYKTNSSYLTVYSYTISQLENWGIDGSGVEISPASVTTISNLDIPVSQIGHNLGQNVYLYKDLLFFVNSNGHLALKWLGSAKPINQVLSTEWIIENPGVFFNNFSIMDYQISNGLQVSLVGIFGAYHLSLNSNSEIAEFVALENSPVSYQNPAISVERLSENRYSLVTEESAVYFYSTFDLSSPTSQMEAEKIQIVLPQGIYSTSILKIIPIGQPVQSYDYLMYLGNERNLNHGTLSETDTYIFDFFACRQTLYPSAVDYRIDPSSYHVFLAYLWGDNPATAIAGNTFGSYTLNMNTGNYTVLAGSALPLSIHQNSSPGTDLVFLGWGIFNNTNLSWTYDNLKILSTQTTFDYYPYKNGPIVAVFGSKNITSNSISVTIKTEETSMGMANSSASGVYTVGQKVNLTASALPGYRFSHWLISYDNGQFFSEWSTQTSLAYIILDTVLQYPNITFKAIFAPVTSGQLLDLTLIYDYNQGYIDISDAPYGLIENTPITFSIRVLTGYTFLGWYLDDSDELITEQPFTHIFGPGSHTLEAVFQSRSDGVAVSAVPVNNDFQFSHSSNPGTVSGGLSRLYFAGETITFFSHPNYGWELADWWIAYQASGERFLIGNNSSLTYTITEEDIVKAESGVLIFIGHFIPTMSVNSVEVVLSRIILNDSDPGDICQSTPSGWYNIGDTVTIYISVNPGFGYDGLYRKNQDIFELVTTETVHSFVVSETDAQAGTVEFRASFGQWFTVIIETPLVSGKEAGHVVGAQTIEVASMTDNGISISWTANPGYALRSLSLLQSNGIYQVLPEVDTQSGSYVLRISNEQFYAGSVSLKAEFTATLITGFTVQHWLNMVKDGGSINVKGNQVALPVTVLPSNSTETWTATIVSGNATVTLDGRTITVTTQEYGAALVRLASENGATCTFTINFQPGNALDNLLGKTGNILGAAVGGMGGGFLGGTGEGGDRWTTLIFIAVPIVALLVVLWLIRSFLTR